jgi:hypothetical protein
MLKRNTIKFAFVLLTMACAFLAATPAQATLTQRCNWGVVGLSPTVWPLSTQVMMMPTVMDFGNPPFTFSQVAFVSFENASQESRDGGGVLRIIDGNCHEIARYPDSSPPPPLPCPANLNTVPDLACRSGLALGNLDNASTDVEIVGVIGGPTSKHKQIIAFNLVGPLNAAHLVVKWCSPPLSGVDFITGSSAPAIAQLDKPPDPHMNQNEIVIDDKVFNYDGTLRYTGLNVAQSNAVVVANPTGSGPQVIVGRRMYKSMVPFWTGTLGWTSGPVSPIPAVYPAVADIVPGGPPEIIVTDTNWTRVRILSSVTGAQLASAPLPNPGYSQCGGPPMIGNVPGIGTVIGVASCSRYTLFKYNGSILLQQVWTTPLPIVDHSGQTTSTLYNTLSGAMIYYNDEQFLRVINAATGVVIQSVPNSSGTVMEGPVIAAFDSGKALGSVIVAANNYATGINKGVRIFDDPSIGPAVSYWNQHTYHYTNILNSYGKIPIVEPWSWLTPAHNTFRVQQWP